MPQKISSLILLDMIGSPDLRLTRDSRSTPALLKLLEVAVAALGHPPSLLSEFSVPVEDDHIAFLERGIPALNIIDFNDLSVWHRAGDETLRINPNSIEKASRIAIMIALTVARDPQAIR
jgi:Zn-dependent M28 family amino/carboxypeptidase